MDQSAPIHPDLNWFQPVFFNPTVLEFYSMHGFVGYAEDWNRVCVYLKDLQVPQTFNRTEDEVVVSVLEIIQQAADAARARPSLCINSKPGDEAKWTEWVNRFPRHRTL
jgi:hypothetical protein